MSEVDRLSNSGLFPALPIADQRSSKDATERRPRPEQSPDKPASKSDGGPESSGPPRPPRSRIDEYA